MPCVNYFARAVLPQGRSRQFGSGPADAPMRMRRQTKDNFSCGT